MDSSLWSEFCLKSNLQCLTDPEGARRCASLSPRLDLSMLGEYSKHITRQHYSKISHHRRCESVVQLPGTFN